MKLEQISVDPFTLWVCHTEHQNYVAVDYTDETLKSIYSVDLRLVVAPYDSCTEIRVDTLFQSSHELMQVLADLNPCNIQERSYATRWGELTITQAYQQKIHCTDTGDVRKVSRRRLRTSDAFQKKVETVKTELVEAWAHADHTSKWKMALARAKRFLDNLNEEYQSYVANSLTTDNWEWDDPDVARKQSEVDEARAQLRALEKELRQLKGQQVLDWLVNQNMHPNVIDTVTDSIKQDKAFRKAFPGY